MSSARIAQHLAERLWPGAWRLGRCNDHSQRCSGTFPGVALFRERKSWSPVHTMITHVHGRPAVPDSLRIRAGGASARGGADKALDNEWLGAAARAAIFEPQHGHNIYLIYQGMIHNTRMALSKMESRGRWVWA